MHLISIFAARTHSPDIASHAKYITCVGIPVHLISIFPARARSRVRGDAYYELLDEFLSAVRRRYGNTTLLQFEDMTYDNASKLLNMYRWGCVRAVCVCVRCVCVCTSMHVCTGVSECACVCVRACICKQTRHLSGSECSGA